MAFFIALMALHINCLEFGHFELLSRYRDGARAGRWVGGGMEEWRGLVFGLPALATSLYLDNHSK